MKIVLIPPLLCSPLAYAPVIDTVWGYGQVTLADTRRDATVAAMAERILQESVGEIAVLGTSMGGYVALEVFRQAPDRVAGLALVSTSARADTVDQVRARERQSALVEDGQFDALVDGAFAGVVAAGRESDETLLAAWRAMTMPVGADAFLRQQRAVIQRADLRSLLPSIGCPTAIIHGAADRLIPIDAAEETAAALPSASFTVISDAGHFLMQEQPEAARAAVDNWLVSLG
jgi:pimeloyl-ACP methyl ester carboxylesterase